MQHLWPLVLQIIDGVSPPEGLRPTVLYPRYEWAQERGDTEAPPVTLYRTLIEAV
jgi:hypothetical protein